MTSPGQIILILKVAVVAVTLLLGGSLLAVWRGHYRLHGRINLVFFVLTLSALLGLEVVARLLDPEGFSRFLEAHEARGALLVHLSFSIPSTLVMPLMLYTGLTRQRQVHLALGWLFLALWTGTFITGVFFLPHEW